MQYETYILRQFWKQITAKTYFSVVDLTGFEGYLLLFGNGFFVGLFGFGLKLVGFLTLVTNPGSVVNCHPVPGLLSPWIAF